MVKKSSAIYMALQLVVALAEARVRAREAPLVPVLKVQAFLHYLDSARNKFERLTAGMLNLGNAFPKFNPALASMVIYGVVIYAVHMGVKVMSWIVMALLDLRVGNHIFKALIHLMEVLNTRSLPALPGLNGLLGFLVGFAMVLAWLNIVTNITANSRGSSLNEYKMNIILSRRSRMIAALPKGRSGCLRNYGDDINWNDSCASPCAICLGCIGEEDEVRILPNCRHYFHISCIDQWLLPCTVNNSSCPLCRTTVINCGLRSLQAQ